MSDRDGHHASPDSPRRGGWTIAAMDIDRHDLAELAAMAFGGDDKSDIPEKIWVDSYGGVMFVRSTWADGLTAGRTEHLERLRDLLAIEYAVEVVAVAYERDLGWDEIDARARALQGVQ